MTDSIKRHPKRYQFILFVASLVILQPVATFGQQNLTVDEQFKKARTVAFDDGNYQEARTIAYRALERSPDYHGIRIFVANLYAWQEQYDKARKELQYVLDKAPDNRGALLSIIDVESWDKRYESALKWSNTALEHYPKDEEFMLEKAGTLRNMERSPAAKKVYLSTIEIHQSGKARQSLKSLRIEQIKSSVSVSYRHDRFSQIFDPWNFLELQLSRGTPYGSIIGRLQYANRFSTDGLQFNLDAYPSITNGLYAYISGGYSSYSIYPDFRFGFSLYKSLPNSFEVEGGIRYLKFSSSETSIYTLSLSKYLGNYLFTARTYRVPSSAGTSQSYNIMARRYFNTARTYIGISGGFGSASTTIQFAEDIRRLNSWSAGISGQFSVSSLVTIGGSMNYDSEEFPNYDRQSYSFKVSASYRF